VNPFPDASIGLAGMMTVSSPRTLISRPERTATGSHIWITDRFISKFDDAQNPPNCARGGLAKTPRYAGPSRQVTAQNSGILRLKSGTPDIAAKSAKSNSEASKPQREVARARHS
jgi:hypothetical protein